MVLLSRVLEFDSEVKINVVKLNHWVEILEKNKDLVRSTVEVKTTNGDVEKRLPSQFVVRMFVKTFDAQVLRASKNSTLVELRELFTPEIETLESKLYKDDENGLDNIEITL